MMFWWLVINFVNGGTVQLPQRSYGECTTNASNVAATQLQSVRTAFCVSGAAAQ